MLGTVVALLVWTLLSFGGASPWAVTPFALGCVLLAIATPREVRTLREVRWLDTALLALVGGTILQFVPMPESWVARLSPETGSLTALLRLDLHPLQAGQRTAGTLSVDPRATLWGAALLIATVLLFWVCRRLFLDGGIRRMVRAIAWTGLAVAFVAIAQRATGPDVIYWTWQSSAEGAEPFGPFVNRNHFATWVIMAVPLCWGYVMARMETRVRDDRPRARVVRLLEFFDARTTWLVTAGSLMTLALVTSLSRSGLLGLGAAFLFTLVLTRGADAVDRRRRAWLITFALLSAALIVAWANLGAVVARLDEALSGGSAERLAIWRETGPIVRDFWLAGTGVGTYETAMLVYQQSARAFYFNQAHNHYLQLAAEGGLLLAVPTIVALVFLARLARRRLSRDRAGLYWIQAGAAAGLVAVAVQSLWETGLRMPANAALAAVLAAIVVHSLRRTREGEDVTAAGV